MCEERAMRLDKSLERERRRKTRRRRRGQVFDSIRMARESFARLFRPDHVHRLP